MTEVKEFAAYNYRIDGNGTGVTVAAAVVSAALAVGAVAALSEWFLPLFAVPVWLFYRVYKSGYSKTLLIGNRYVILGDRIIYYRNVTGISIDGNAQTMTLLEARGRKLVIAAANFPTNARKDFKIKANKTAKFEKVTGRLIAKVRELAPGVSV